PQLGADPIELRGEQRDRGRFAPGDEREQRVLATARPRERAARHHVRERRRDAPLVLLLDVTARGLDPRDRRSSARVVRVLVERLLERARRDLPLLRLEG